MTNTITINNKEYVLIKETTFTHKGTERTEFQVRKPQGKEFTLLLSIQTVYLVHLLNWKNENKFKKVSRGRR